MSNGQDLATRVRVILVLALLALLGSLALQSCSQERAQQREEQRQREETWSFDVPLPLLTAEGWRIQPVTVTGRRVVTETTSGQVSEKTTISAPELAGVLAATLRQAFPALGALGSFSAPPPPPRNDDGTPVVPLGAGMGSIVAAWIGKEIVASRGRRQNDQAWDEQAKAREDAAYHKGWREGYQEAARAEGARPPLRRQPEANPQGAA